MLAQGETERARSSFMPDTFDGPMRLGMMGLTSQGEGANFTISGRHVGALRVLAGHAPGIIERPLPINVSGAIPAVILDAGWPLEALKAVPLLARTAGLAAHLYEESLRSIGFILSHKADQAIAYDGPAAGTGAAK